MKIISSHFLWPKMKFKFTNIFGSKTISNLENELYEMFPSGHPVICSSGRVALYIALNELKFDRSKNFNLYPYASHCIINTVARLTNPIPYKLTDKMKIVYHQWGIKFNCNYSPLIEDSVDSLYEKKTPLFAMGSKFEIWSLSKILGTSSGGVLWCKNEKDAISIRSKIENKRGILFSWILRLLGSRYECFYPFWEGTEKGYKGISAFQVNEILSRIKEWDSLVKNRKEKLRKFLKYSILKEKELNGRLPSCLPLKIKINNKKLYEMGFSTGARHFHYNSQFEKVFPLPIHQDVNIISLNKIINFSKNGQ